jgi:hypothetical protein
MYVQNRAVATALCTSGVPHNQAEAEPKTAKSRRRIELPKSVVAALRRHREKLINEGFGDGP